MRAMPLLLIVALTACAGTSSSSAPAPAAQTVRVVGSGTGAALRMDASGSSSIHTLSASADQVWRALPAVFDSLGVPVATVDASKRIIGNSGFKVRTRLKGVSLSRYIDCGNSTQIGANADSYDVHLVMTAEVQPAETAGTAKVITHFQALAKPVNFSQEYSQCSSKGSLETKFIDILNARLQR